jgi:uncharacterized protein (DUF3820 family)
MTNYQEYKYTIMPWGKYRGRYLSNIPDDYLKWCILNYKDPGMCEMMAVELQRRDPEYRNLRLTAKDFHSRGKN